MDKIFFILFLIFSFHSQSNEKIEINADQFTYDKENTRIYATGNVEIIDQEFKNKNKYFHCYWFSPIEGRMLIFPSHLQHHVKENKSDEDRISVSFNIQLK